jgi:hypothetical protein
LSVMPDLIRHYATFLQEKRFRSPESRSDKKDI